MDLRSADILHWWRNGIQLNLPNAFLEVNLSQDANNSPCIEIKTSQSEPGRRLHVLAVEHVEALITDWFHGLSEGRKVSRLIPCVVCEEKGMTESQVFTLEDCLKASDSPGYIECHKHSDTPVPLSNVAPDISLHDVHPDLLLKHHELHYDEHSYIKEGSFGKIFPAVLRKQAGPQKHVAIKEYKGDELQSFRELRKEVNVLRRITHPNLIEMVGVVSKPRLLALELAEGSLSDVLFDKDAARIPRLVLIAIAKEIASALAVLHWHKIIHRDLKASNVLIFSLKEDDPVHVKVSDFGTANFAGPYGMRAPVTRTHMRAPEVLEFALKEEYSVEVDIYSFAMLLYAMISRERAFDKLQSSEIRSGILQQKRPPWRRIQDAMGKFANLTRLMCVSWSQSPSDRPTADHCQKQLENAGFQALMSKLAFPPTNTVYFVHFVPCNEELWLVHRIDTSTFLSVFTGNFSSNSKLCFEISANEDSEVEAVCVHYDTMVVMKRSTNETKMTFKIFSLTDSSLVATLNGDSLAVINGIAVTNNHIFLATDLGCFTAAIDGQTSGSLDVRCLSHDPSSFELILLSKSKLWLSNHFLVAVYSILMDSKLVPLYDLKEHFIPGIKHLQNSHLDEDAVWAITDSAIFKLNADQILCQFELQTLFRSRRASLSSQGQVTCMLPESEVLWLGLSTGAIVIIDLDTGQVLSDFQPYTGPVRYLVSSPDTQPPMVISCGRSPSEFLGTEHTGNTSPLSIDSSEVVKVGARRPSRTPGNSNANFEDTWDDVQGFSDVLLVWHAMTRTSWRRIQKAHDEESKDP